MKYFLSAIILLAIISCNNDSTPSYDSSLPQSPYAHIPPPAPITFNIDTVYYHDPTAFTQGLEFYNGKLYEGTGELKQSRLRIVNIKTGKAEKEMLIKDPEIFGEGITIFKNKIYQLTWQNNKIFEYNLNDFSEPLITYNWSREGWGATNDGKSIIISDGSSHLYFVQPDEKRKEMKIEKVMTVVSNTGEVDSLNELELIDGYVYANRWLTDDIVKIDTSNGHVTGIMNLKGLLKQYDPSAKIEDGAVLNGIAYDSAMKKMYITGKDWPRLFELSLH